MQSKLYPKHKIALWFSIGQWSCLLNLNSVEFEVSEEFSVPIVPVSFHHQFYTAQSHVGGERYLRNCPDQIGMWACVCGIILLVS